MGHSLALGHRERKEPRVAATGSPSVGEDTPVHQMRAVTLANYLEVANSVGLDGQRMLRQAGISPNALADPENRLPASAVISLLDGSAELSGCESFGLLMAEARSFASLGPLSLLLERLPNVREIIRAAIDFQRHMNDIVAISLEDVGETCLIRLDLAPGFWSVQVFDHLVAMSYRVLTAASDGAWKPDCAHLVRKQPDDPAPWRRVLSVPIEFDATFNGLSSTAEAMQRPNPNADETMARNARRLLHLVHVEAIDTTSERVRRSIALLLPSGRATIDQIAAQLGMSTRSLQRRLDDEGRQFAELLNGVRRELATAYLANSAHPITTVAGLLGYASPSSFTRWFAGTFGTSPQAWRAGVAANDDAVPPPVWRR
jgi:AraC-like DNA-binding protein